MGKEKSVENREIAGNKVPVPGKTRSFSLSGGGQVLESSHGDCHHPWAADGLRGDATLWMMLRTLPAVLERNTGKTQSQAFLGCLSTSKSILSYSGRKWLLVGTKLFIYDNKSQLSHRGDTQGEQFFLPV